MIALTANELVAVSTGFRMIITKGQLASCAEGERNVPADIGWKLLFTPFF